MVVDDAVKHYRSGACFAMAEALHRLTGYSPRYVECGNFVHAFVVSPEGDVLDIHGRAAWPEFLTFLVSSRVIEAEAVARIEHKAYSALELDANIYWRQRGFKPPSETAIRKAIAVARRHPNFVGEPTIQGKKPKGAYGPWM